MNFDDFAKNWDTERRISRAKVVADEINRSIDNGKAYTAMEFGCGTGLVSFNLHDKFKSIMLVDSSEGMIDVLQSKIQKYNINNMTPLKLDMTKGVLLGDWKFDVIYNSMVIHHIGDTEGIIRSFYELLNKGGYLCLVDLNQEDGSFHREEAGFDGHNGFDQKKLKRILSQAGFQDIESNTFYNDVKEVDGQNTDYSLFLMRARK